MSVDVFSLDWHDLLMRMDKQGFKTAYEVLDHCHVSQFYKLNGNEYSLTIECCAGTYECVIQPKFANAIRFAVMLQFKAHDVTLRVIDLDKAFFCKGLKPQK